MKRSREASASEPVTNSFQAVTNFEADWNTFQRSYRRHCYSTMPMGCMNPFHRSPTRFRLFLACDVFSLIFEYFHSGSASSLFHEFPVSL